MVISFEEKDRAAIEAKDKYCANCKWYEQSICMRTYNEKKCSAELVAPNWSCENHETKMVRQSQQSCYDCK